MLEDFVFFLDFEQDIIKMSIAIIIGFLSFITHFINEFILHFLGLKDILV
ncbi:hypothetical protein F0310_02260 [Borrelia sp. A-FGy1]|nr:hypothetical protein F0310_02260 [Borrelia sp. A-FGy1]